MVKKICFSAVLFCLSLPGIARAETVERVAAIAGDDVITLSDVRKEGVLRLAVKGADIRDIDGSDDGAQTLEALVRELVQARLIAREARKNNIHIGQREVDMQLREMYAKSGQSEEAFKAMMAQEGIDWEDYREYLRSEIETQFVIRAELAGQVSPSEADVVACAQEKAPDAKNSVTVTLRQIMIPEIEADSSAGLSAPIAKNLNATWWNALDKAARIYAGGIRDLAAANPERFLDYVKRYSSGRSAEREGLLGSFSPGDLSREFSAVFTLQAGEISPLISTKAGYHIIRVDDVAEGESEAWGKAKDLCREQIAMKESQHLVESWLSDLMAKNFVSILVNHDISQKTPEI